MALPSGFLKPCLTAAFRSLWVHEIKQYRLMVRRGGLRVRCFTRNGNNWADRFPSIVEAAARLEAHSFLIDGEVVVGREDGAPDFHAEAPRQCCTRLTCWSMTARTCATCRCWTQAGAGQTARQGQAASHPFQGASGR